MIECAQKVSIAFFPSRSSARICLRNAKFSRVYKPCFRAFLLPFGAPDPAAPPCMRHRALPETAGAWHGVPLRVFAPQRGLLRMGPVLRLCVPATPSPSLSLQVGAERPLRAFQTEGTDHARRSLLRRIAGVKRRQPRPCQQWPVRPPEH